MKEEKEIKDMHQKMMEQFESVMKKNRTLNTTFLRPICYKFFSEGANFGHQAAINWVGNIAAESKDERTAEPT